MKKTLLIALIFVIAGQTAVNAQHYGQLDTIPGRYKDFYYPEWYDECPIFRDGSVRFRPSYMSFGYGTYLRQNYTPRPMVLKGVAVMVVPENWGLGIHPVDTIRRPQYVHVYQWDPSQSDSLLFLDSARWDTITPRVMCLPAVCDSVAQSDTSIPYYYCYVYECRFEKPVTIDSFFYIGGTNYGCNDEVFVERLGYVPACLRITYLAMRSNSGSKSCPMNLRGAYWRGHSNMPWHYEPLSVREEYYGMFLAIVDNHYLNVHSADSTMGTVTGSGLFPDQSYDTIAAIPNPGYAFLHWNDGSTANPRVVCLNHDTSFTAYFREDRDFFVQLASNNDDWGTVTGQGYYSANSTATIKATPNSGYIFDRWSDGNLLSTRSITVTQDTTLTAYFYVDSSLLGISTPSESGLHVTLRPNPADSRVEIEADSHGEYTVELLNARGTVALQAVFSGTKTSLDLSALPSGTYIVRIATTAGTAYKKLVVK